MNFADVGISGIASITVMCYLVGLVVKLTPWDNNKVIPVVCGITGVVLGLLWFGFGWTGFPASDPITAAAIGAVSGLAATGADQIYKQTKQ